MERRRSRHRSRWPNHCHWCRPQPDRPRRHSHWTRNRPRHRLLHLRYQSPPHRPRRRSKPHRPHRPRPHRSAVPSAEPVCGACASELGRGHAVARYHRAGSAGTARHLQLAVRRTAAVRRRQNRWTGGAFVLGGRGSDSRARVAVDLVTLPGPLTGLADIRLVARDQRIQVRALGRDVRLTGRRPTEHQNRCHHSHRYRPRHAHHALNANSTGPPVKHALYRQRAGTRDRPSTRARSCPRICSMCAGSCASRAPRKAAIASPRWSRGLPISST